MTGTGSPCGACKFLRRKCERGCVFAPFFCHDNGAKHFAAIHKIFGASNVSKILSHLPISARSEAAVTISYEAQARLQDPIYGCVSHIFALQQQVVNLQAQLVSLKQQASQTCFNGTSFTTTNPNEKLYGTQSFYPYDMQNLFEHQQSLNLSAHFDVNFNFSHESKIGVMNQISSFGNHENLNLPDDEDGSFLGYEEASLNQWHL